MYIVHIASECAPIAKVGGLGDVVYGLAKEQQKNGNRVEIILPKYDILKYDCLQNLKVERGDLWSFEENNQIHNTIWRADLESLTTYLIEPHHEAYYFNRGYIYGGSDDIERFLYFSRTALEFLYKQDKKPDIIHIHDWPTAIVAPLVHHLYRDLGFHWKGIVFTIHNMEHQGKCFPSHLSRIGLRGEDFRSFDKMQDPNNPSLLNLLKGGIVFSDYVTTVSPRYREEIKTPEGGAGLDRVVRAYSSKIKGILNGIEVESWNPAKDPHLPFPYPSNPTFISTIRKQKEENKKALCKKLQIQADGKPLIGCVTRLVKQKAPYLIKEAIHYTLENNGSFVLLGTPGDQEIRNTFEHLKESYRGHPNLYIGLYFDESLSHLIYAASDGFIIPSLYEPCGLTQMIAMRYGAVPIARKTGGLADTVFDSDDTSIPKEGRTGFCFETADRGGVEYALQRVFETFRNEPAKWDSLIKNGVSCDFSWKKAALTYQKIYFLALLRNRPLAELALLEK
ncbi:MAG: glycogen synthase [Verrucomicrobia bacterium]|nr:glycogen synthase [Verrucomicrobiota bacterium]